MAFVFIGCGDEKPSPQELVVGTWKLKIATRNGKITNSLDGMYMAFENANSFDSNILGDTSSFSTVIENDQIKIDHDLIQTFDIEEISDSLMKLGIKINDDKLLLVLIK